MDRPLVSTIVPIRDRWDLARQAIESVLAQTWRPIECIVVDDGSGSETANRLDDLARLQPDVRVIHQENSGPGRARETGRLAAAGALIQYLDSDDLYLPEKTERLVSALEDSPGMALAWCQTRYLDSEGGPAPIKPPVAELESMFPAFLIAQRWETSVPLYRRELSDAAGPWPPAWTEEDWTYSAQIALQRPSLHFVDEDLVIHRDHSAGRLSDEPPAERKLAAMLEARRVVCHAAKVLGIDPSSDELRHFVRAQFLLARQAGSRGYPDLARAFFDLAADASPDATFDMRVYRLLAATFGWKAAGKTSEWIDRFRGA